MDNKGKHKTYLSDSSSVKSIDMPRLGAAGPEQYHRPREYWTTYNKGVSLFNRGKYEQAKDEFLKLHSLGMAHKALYTHLSKVYRNAIARHVKQQQYKVAYGVYMEYFDVCVNYITNSDRRKFNKLTEILSKTDSDSKYRKIPCVSLPKFSFQIIDAPQGRIKFSEEVGIGGKTGQRRVNWKFVEPIRAGTIYVKSIYNKDLAKYDKTLVKVTDEAGDVSNESVLNHGVYRFKASENSDRFVASSEDMILYLYSLSKGCLGTYELLDHTDNKYHIRCVDISPNGEYLLFTHIDSVNLLDSGLRVIENWQIPVKDESRKSVLNYEKNISILGLHGKASNDEIKKAFRRLVFKHHPDRNPGDPQATEKTRKFISAYEELTGKEARHAFQELKNAEYYYTIIDRIKVEIPGTSFVGTLEFGMPGPGGDWIYATLLDNNAESIYLGCYSGKVYCVSRDGCILKVYNCWDVIRSIRKRGRHLFIRTDDYLYIIEDDQYSTHITVGKGNLRWCNRGLIVIDKKDLWLYSYEGIKIGEISFKKSIHDAYWIQNSLAVTTANKYYSFSIS